MKYILLAVVALCGLLSAADDPTFKDPSAYFRGIKPEETADPLWTYQEVEPSTIPETKPSQSSAPNYMGVKVRTDPGKVEVQVATGPVKAFFARLKEKREERLRKMKSKRNSRHA